VDKYLENTYPPGGGGDFLFRAGDWTVVMVVVVVVVVVRCFEENRIQIESRVVVLAESIKYIK